MKYVFYSAILTFFTAPVFAVENAPSPALSVEPSKATLSVYAEGITRKGNIENEYAFCIPDAQKHVQEGQDKNIGLSWSKGPEGTKSYAVIAVDPDVPTVFDDANKEGKTISANLPRKNFYHWVLVDIPPDVLQIPPGADSQAIVQHGKYLLKTPFGTRGTNDFSGYFGNNPDRKGVYAGYDGPCPPWNDELIHHYHFNVYAVDVPSLGLKDPATGAQAEAAISKHILAHGEVVGTYSLNPALVR